MDKPIIYTQHALAVLAERKLDRHWIERATITPEWSEQDPLDAAIVRKFAVVPERENRYLRVVCVETNDYIRAISAFLDRRARPK